TRAAASSLAVSAKPRPDLQVQNILIPDHVAAGANLSVDFDVINQGTVATDIPHWVDRVYLSLDTTIDPGPVLLGEIPNPQALWPGEHYRSSAGPVTVPQRFGGDVYVIVAVDYKHQEDQWPNGAFNIVSKVIHVDPLPLPDLVMSNVVAPDQVVGGTTIPVS